MLLLSSPTVLRLIGYENKRAELNQHLQYVDKKVDFELKKFKGGSFWYIKKFGVAAFQHRLAELKASRTKTMLFQDQQGLWTYSGVALTLSRAFDDEVKYEYELPDARMDLPWATIPEGEDRYYQVDSKSNLLDVGHGGVEIGTGLGKSRIIRNLLKTLALRALIMAPSENIALQLYDDLVLHFGKKHVGFVGAGKKQYDKRFTVAIAASLTRIEPKSPAWEQLSQAQIFIADESHLCPAQTLAKVCFGLMANAPYRFFFSGTQMRNDGLDALLGAITGPIVYQMTVREGVDQDFLAKPIFRMMRIHSTVNFDSADANELTREHVYYNPQVITAAADLANKAVSLMARPTLILVDELEQFGKLLPHLRYEARFAHGGVNKDNKDKVPADYHDSDPKQLVANFNAGKFPILVGTSCIATGTDIKAVKCGIYLRGGKSEIELKQGVGRTTRKVPGKDDCLWFDFEIVNVETLARHAMARKVIYADIYPGLRESPIQ